MVSRRRGRGRGYRLIAALTPVIVLLGIAVPAGTAQAADNSQFQTGSIISDELFFSGGDLDEQEVQSFLSEKGSRCVPSSSGIACLKDYRTTTNSRAADSRCDAYTGAANESAARVIAKVSKACGVSARVLLVLLQKEQGLVTASGSSLTSGRYQAATGYGCPDGAPCSSLYYGFFNQVYMAASRFKEYSQNPTRFRHQPGAWNSVLFHPSAVCGSSKVFIANRATAGLYNYTPYQPNAASLAAGAGTGNSCSSYGNRNFWRYFTDWFGDTQLIARGAVNGYFWSGGNAARLGPPLFNESPLANGSQQKFKNGTVYTSNLGVFSTTGAIRSGYEAAGATTGALGFPAGEQVSVGAGQQQKFQNGHGFAASGRPFAATLGAIDQKYMGQGGPAGTLGWPTGFARCDVGCVLDLKKDSGQMVSIVWSGATGAHVVASSIRAGWLARGGTAGPGFPLADEAATRDGGGSIVEFRQGSRIGTALWSPATSTKFFGGPVREAWYRSGDVVGLGYATADESALNDGLGSWTPFDLRGRKGAVVWGPETGAHVMIGGFLSRWESDSGVHGLGYPTSDESRAADGVGSILTFRRGAREAVLLWHPNTGVNAIGGAVKNAWSRSGGVLGLGYPLADEAQTPDKSGSFAEFRRGSLEGMILWSSKTGAAYLSGPALDLWKRSGGLATLGYPLADERLTGLGRSTETRFASGDSIVANPDGATVVVPRAVASAWASAGGALGRYGLPLGASRTNAGVVTQDFTGGTISVPLA
ncbi:hypothetical protein FFI11_018120 [Oerskovia sp. KBS0722]|nr:hypothetical protein FFI11_018120 [Oerskovia sp. KBS0722]